MQKGFSLVEIMVGVAILAILASIAAPAAQDMIAQSRLSGQTNDLVSAVQAARGEAIKRNQPIRFCRTSSSSSNDCPGTGNWEHWIIVNPADSVIRRGSINTALKLTSTLTSGVLTFLPDGTNTVTADTNDALSLCSPTGSGNTTRVISIGVAGRTSITKSSGTCS